MADKNKTLARALIAGKLRGITGDKCRRILLINPPQIPGDRFDANMARNKRYFAYPPYGIGLLRNALTGAGYEARIIDLNYQLLSAARSSDAQAGPDGWEKYLKDVIGSLHPDIAGISCMFTMHYDRIKETAALIKDCDPDICVVAGGMCVTNSPEDILRGSGNIDFVCLYEGDSSFVTMLDYINGKARAGQLHHIAALIDGGYASLNERIPPGQKVIDMEPDYGDINIGEYSSVGECGSYRFWLPENTRVATVLSNRGCRGNCKFCSVRGFCGRGVRSRSVKCVVDEIESLMARYGIGHISWLDDDLLFDKERAIRLFKKITERNLNITWDASNGVIASSLDAEIMRYAVQSGCVGMHFGLESGNAGILRNSRKPSGLKDYKRVSAIVKDFPEVFTKGFLMIGFPGEAVGQLLETVNMALDVSLDWYTIQLLSLLPATDLSKEMAEKDGGRMKGPGPGDYNYGTSQMGTQRAIEQKGRAGAEDVVDYLGFPEDYVPAREQLNDIWFLMDYRINYERILSEEDPVKLRKYRSILYDICDRMTTDNPLGNFFLGVVERKLGNRDAGESRMSLCRQYLAGHVLWQKRLMCVGLAEKPWRQNRKES